MDNALSPVGNFPPFFVQLCLESFRNNVSELIVTTGTDTDLIIGPQAERTIAIFNGTTLQYRNVVVFGKLTLTTTSNNFGDPLNPAVFLADCVVTVGPIPCICNVELVANQFFATGTQFALRNFLSNYCPPLDKSAIR